LDRLISAGVAVLRALARALTRIDNFSSCTEAMNFAGGAEGI
jgi:hypothetical protein